MIMFMLAIAQVSRPVFLAVELERGVGLAASAAFIFSFEHELALDEQARRAAAGVVDCPCPARGP